MYYIMDPFIGRQKKPLQPCAKNFSPTKIIRCVNQRRHYRTYRSRYYWGNFCTGIPFPWGGLWCGSVVWTGERRKAGKGAEKPALVEETVYQQEAWKCGKWASLVS
ncbi:hypothetical protein E2C01_079791 [Portunus trituberculatus]|uniref:Uncharacterized protein n=1 Tax=Portunus trituberculatus TaxID=210409 RepID=A0A5B7IRR3_PORTR|nr:hypothetical protein [Portunus trituberculatus]